jgi:electron transport complex protein RnfD
MVKAPMTKNLLMQYTIIALFFIALLSYFAFGLPSLAISLVSVGVAIGCDLLLSMVMGSKSPKDMMSAIVFGLIVAMSYSLGLPLMRIEDVAILTGYEQLLYPAIISAVGMIIFKKLAGLAGRKYVNPAAIAKLIVLGLLFMTILPTALMPEDHLQSINLQNPLTESGFEGYPDFYPMDTVTFGSNLLTCYSINQMNPYNLGTYENPLPDVLFTMLVAKNHGWIGGFSSILVMAIGLVLFAVCRGYIKWRITLSYLVTTAIISAIMGFIFGGDILMRALFHVFMGSSIFMAFFMATDPATTPLTRLGQNIFGICLAIITVVIQTLTGFLGASILALVIMNLTCPVLDKVGAPKASKERVKIKLPKGKKRGDVKVTKCIRCGQCLTTCCKNLPVILIKEAADKGNWEKVDKLGAAYCDSCGHCTFICPARIDLKTIIVSARDKIQK